MIAIIQKNTGSQFLGIILLVFIFIVFPFIDLLPKMLHNADTTYRRQRDEQLLASQYQYATVIEPNNIADGRNFMLVFVWFCAYMHKTIKTNIKFWRYFFIFRRKRLKIKKTFARCANAKMYVRVREHTFFSIEIAITT